MKMLEKMMFSKTLSSPRFTESPLLEFLITQLEKVMFRSGAFASTPTTKADDLVTIVQLETTWIHSMSDCCRRGLGDTHQCPRRPQIPQTPDIP